MLRDKECGGFLLAVAVTLWVGDDSGHFSSAQSTVSIGVDLAEPLRETVEKLTRPVSVQRLLISLLTRTGDSSSERPLLIST